MSYEGREIWCCINGHISQYDAYVAPSNKEDWQCPYCDAKAFDVGYIDETNGLPYALNFLIKKLNSVTEEGQPQRYSFIKTEQLFYRDSPFINEWDNVDEIVRKCASDYEYQWLIDNHHLD